MANKHPKETHLSATPASEPSLETLVKEAEEAKPEVAKTDPAPTAPETFRERLDRFVVESAGTASRYSDSSQEDLVFYLKLVGETGEVSDLLGKFLGHGHPYNREKLLDEVGDVVWYCAAIQRKHGRKSVGLEPFQHIGNLEETMGALVPHVARFKPNFMRESGPMEVTECCNRIISLLMGLIREADLAFAGTQPTYIHSDEEAIMADVLERNQAKLKARYPLGFQPERSINRTEEKLLVPHPFLRPGHQGLGSPESYRSKHSLSRDVYAGGCCSFWVSRRRDGDG